MKIFIFVLFTLLSVNVSAGPYVDFGLGYIKNLPSKLDGTVERNGTVIIRVNDSAESRIDSPFIMFRVGYEFEDPNIYLEFNRFGLLDQKEESISSWRLYKRFELYANRSGPYIDLGGGIINYVPEKTETKTEDMGSIVLTANSTVTIDIDSPFLMFRLGYKWESTNLHIEYERFGKLKDRNRSISNLRLYKRWEWD